MEEIAESYSIRLRQTTFRIIFPTLANRNSIFIRGGDFLGQIVVSNQLN